MEKKTSEEKRKKREGVTDRALELALESEYEVRVSKFLTPQEQILARDALHAAGRGADRCFFWGGCRGTERCAAVFLPDWAVSESLSEANLFKKEEREAAFAAYLAELDNPVAAEIPIVPVLVTGSGFQTLSHRDFMGAILSLGIERNMIGDILVQSEREALVFAMGAAVPLLLTELEKIGRDGVTCRRTTVSPADMAKREFEEMTVTVSSLRLDGVISHLTGDGRAAAAAYIARGLVERNYFPAVEGSAEVRPGDILSIRGYGKFVVGETDGVTRSGRLRLHCRKYR